MGSLSRLPPVKPVFKQEPHEGHQDQDSQAKPDEILDRVIPEEMVWVRRTEGLLTGSYQDHLTTCLSPFL